MQLHCILKRFARRMSNAVQTALMFARRRTPFFVGSFAASVVLLASACGSDGNTPQSAREVGHGVGSDWDVVEAGGDVRWLPVLATRDLAVGVKRIAFSLDGLRANEPAPTIRVSLFALDADRELPRSVQYARFIPYDPGVGITAHAHANSSVSDRALPVGRGVYVAPIQLDAAGLWGVLLEMSSDEAEEEARIRFSVRERPSAPRVGEPAPSIDSRTRSQAESLAELTSDPDPEPGLYAVSIAEALEQGRPLLLAFATPAYCHSRTCAPVLDTVKAVWREFSDRINGIHVEVFENPDNPQRLVESEAFAAWRLPSEPWVFVIDADGVIRYAFEGAVTEAELRSAVEWVVQESGT